MNQKYDIIIVGAGPVGSKTAQIAAQKGAKVLLIDQKSTIGKPVKCSGIISKRAFKKAGTSKNIVCTKIKGATVFTSKDEKFKFTTEDTKAYVIDRKKFDQCLFQKAKKEGVHTRKQTRAINYNPPLLTIEDQDGKQSKIKTKLVIGADGVESKVRKWSQLPAPPEKIYGFQAILQVTEKRRRTAKVYFDQNLYNNFFGWSIPVGKKKLRVGLGTKEPKKMQNSLQTLIQKQPLKTEIITYQGGTIDRKSVV